MFRPRTTWGYSSAGRALEWHSRGHRFDPDYLHQEKPCSRNGCEVFSFSQNKKVVAHAAPHAFPGSGLAPLPCLEASWLSTVRQLALALRIHLPYAVIKVQNGLYISQKSLVFQTSLFSRICRNAA